VAAPEHSELPLRDYDHLPVSAVAQRIRSLTSDELGQLLDYERAHAARPAVEQVMRTRLAELRAGAEPTGGRRQTGPDWPEPAAARRPPNSEPTAAGPPSFPPPHGTPDQPARPKADKQSP
jgi:hypothetical protein